MIKLLRTVDDSQQTVCFQSPFGPMRLLASEAGISKLEFVQEPTAGADCIPGPARAAIDLICNNIEPAEPISLLLNCSDFQFKVLGALLEIPCGQTATYSQVAAAIGRPKAVRAVASAIARNPIALLIPCHRVVPAGGGVGQYRWRAELKRALLNNERLRTLSEHSAP